MTDTNAYAPRPVDRRSSLAEANIERSAERAGWTAEEINNAHRIYRRGAEGIEIYFNAAGSITSAALLDGWNRRASLGRRDAEKLAHVMRWFRADAGTEVQAPTAPVGKLTYTALLPDGRTATRSSATMAYTHLLAVRSGEADTWGVFSWHKSPEAAHKAANAGGRYSASAAYRERRVIPVTGHPFSSTEGKAARAAEKAGTVDVAYLRTEAVTEGTEALAAEAARERDADAYGAALKPEARGALVVDGTTYTETATPVCNRDGSPVAADGDLCEACQRSDVARDLFFRLHHGMGDRAEIIAKLREMGEWQEYCATCDTAEVAALGDVCEECQAPELDAPAPLDRAAAEAYPPGTRVRLLGVPEAWGTVAANPTGTARAWVDARDSYTARAVPAPAPGFVPVAWDVHGWDFGIWEHAGDLIADAEAHPYENATSEWNGRAVSNGWTRVYGDAVSNENGIIPGLLAFSHYSPTGATWRVSIYLDEKTGEIEYASVSRSATYGPHDTRHPFTRRTVTGWKTPDQRGTAVSCWLDFDLTGGGYAEGGPE